MYKKNKIKIINIKKLNNESELKAKTAKTVAIIHNITTEKLNLTLPKQHLVIYKHISNNFSSRYINVNPEHFLCNWMTKLRKYQGSKTGSS
jgi:type IV secretory pathway component VirB8